MGVFLKTLSSRQQNPTGRRWIYVPYDQMSDAVGPLSREDPATLGILLIETSWKGNRRPYHKQKLALILANSRHFALEQAARGVAVRYVFASTPYMRVIQEQLAELGALRVMIPAERELRKDLESLGKVQGIAFLPHEGWVTQGSHFLERKAPWRMDAFYRQVRQDTGLLMRSGKPEGGQYSYDTENRLPWKGEPSAPNPPSFPLDPIKEEVGRLINRKFSHHPGDLDLKALPSTREDANKLWTWAKSKCLPFFGPYEDAMSTQSSNLFHTRLSQLVNIHRILPAQVLRDVQEMDLPLASKEGFVRQVLGWREFVHQVHGVTDGFRALPGTHPTASRKPGDGGYRRWAGKSWSTTHGTHDPDGGASPSVLGAKNPLPPAYWGEPSGLACLDRVVSCVWREAYSHHITRLMVLSNIATLLDVSPRELTDWFWVAYVDAYDWVVEPNVLGMGTYALGDLMTTKPYVSGTPYILRMSNYCEECAFDPKRSCPMSSLYWAFLKRHEEGLRKNPRMRVPLSRLAKRTQSLSLKDRAIYEKVQENLIRGDRLTPKAFEDR